MRRREFISLIGGVAATWPLAARAQQPAMPVVGFLNSASALPWELRRWLPRGFERGWLCGRPERHHRVSLGRGPLRPAAGMAADLVRRKVAVLVATGGTPSVVAAKAATSTIPIVFTTGSDPVRRGFVTSLSRPGGNITGVNFFVTVLEGKRLGLLRALVPGLQLIAVLFNPDRPTHATEVREVQEAARAIGQQIHILLASNESAINAAFATATQLHAGAMLVGADPFFNSQRDKIIALAARHSIPAIYEQREFAQAGGLMSYGTNLTDGYRQVGVYVGRILKGEKPGDLPVVQSTKFEFVINLKTAKALGLTVPEGLLNAADEVIE